MNIRDKRLNAIKRFAVGMTDIKIHRHPLMDNVTVVLCDVERDHYGDIKTTPTSAVHKEVIIQKNPNLDYINDATGVLSDDSSSLPWIAVLTLTDLPRTLHQGDYITYEQFDYKVSGVRPLNRNNPYIIKCFLHPQRDTFGWNDTSPFVDANDILETLEP